MFTNLNNCKSFTQVATTNLTALSSYQCSEVIISNKSGQGLLVSDNNDFDTTHVFLLSAGETFTFSGVSNANQLSAKTTSGSGSIYYRTQEFSSYPQQ
jgi:hypothetical protein